MKALLESIYAFAVAIGGPGLLLIAFLDSSFLSFPQANDLLIVLMVAREPAWMTYYAGMATLGSLLGCVVLAEVARYAPPEPVASDIDERLAGIEARLGTLAFEAALRRSGLDRQRLRVLLRQDALIESYLAQRFSVTAMPTEEQVLAFYAEHRAELGGAPDEATPTEAALARARERLTAERRARLVAEWVDDLKRRAQVTLRGARP